MTPCVDDRGQLLRSLDAFGDDHGPELVAKTNQRPNEREAPRPRPQTGDQLPIQFDHARFEVREVTEVRVAGAEIVDDNVDTPRLYLL